MHYEDRDIIQFQFSSNKYVGNEVMLHELCLLRYKSRIQIEMTYSDIRVQCFIESGELRRYEVTFCVTAHYLGTLTYICLQHGF